MPKGKVLVARDNEGRCDAITFETNWKRNKKQDLRCPFVARLLIGTKHLCHRHAQCEALALLVESKVAKIIPVPERRLPYQRVGIATKGEGHG